MKKLLQSKRRGSAIPLAVVAIIILLAMGVGLLSLGFNSRVYSIRNASDIEARCAADAGLTMALFEMNEKLKVKPWNDSALPLATNVKLPNSDEVCSYRVTGSLAGGYIIQSLGESGEAKRGVSATIKLQSAFSHAILTKNQLVLKSDTIVDGYNSLDPADTEFVIDIGSQSNADDSVVLNMGSVVNGNVFVATGADLDDAIKGAGTVKGDEYTVAPEPLPAVTVPALPPKLAIEAAGQTITLTPADSGTYPEIYLRQLVEKVKGVTTTIPSVLEVTGGDVELHLTGDIQLENSCEIIVKNGSTLTIYTDGNIHSRNGSSISTENPPEAATTLQIYATGEDKQFIDIKAKSEFTGTIYAPDDDVVLYAQGDAYGSVIADSFNYMAGGNFYYDEALRDNVSVDDEAVVFTIERWYESAPMLYADIRHLDMVPIPIEQPVK
ncbi:MAG: DUF7305 domain-containing protein [Planctomycetota bacterium]|jgi:hypothetical protein